MTKQFGGPQSVRLNPPRSAHNLCGIVIYLPYNDLIFTIFFFMTKMPYAVVISSQSSCLF